MGIPSHQDVAGGSDWAAFQLLGAHIEEGAEAGVEAAGFVGTLGNAKVPQQGFIVMVDSTRPETFREARSILETFRAYAPTPYVVAANKQDMSDAWEPQDMLLALRLDPKIKFLPCVATDKHSVKSVLLELLYTILAEMESGEI